MIKSGLEEIYLGLRPRGEEDVRGCRLSRLGMYMQIAYFGLVWGVLDREQIFLPCLIPIRRLPRPSRFMHFGDEPDTDGRAQNSFDHMTETHALQAARNNCPRDWAEFYP